jgi:purine-binding chemotaxis protein CheW
MREGSASAQSALLFRAAGHLCAIPSNRVTELVLLPELLRVPAQPALLDGFLNLRGVPVPVVSFARLFGQDSPAPDLHTPLVLVHAPGGLLALRVDRVEDVAAVPPDAILPAAAHDSLNECAEGQFPWNGEIAVLLAADRLLLRKEQECVADLEALARQRLEALEAQPG